MKAHRQRKKKVPSAFRGLRWARCGLPKSGVGASIILYPLVAHGATLPSMESTDSATVSARVLGGVELGVVPPFRAAPRKRSSAGVDFRWWVSERVRLDGAWSWIRDDLPAGHVVHGAGDVELGVWTALNENPSAALGLGWAVKLPNAADEGELGTDETDVSVFSTLSTSLVGLELSALGGVAILGDPNRFANQDDAALIGLEAARMVGPVHLRTTVGGTLGTTRNPARLSGAAGLWGGCPYRLGTEVQVGLTPAAPGWGLRTWVGWGAGCD